MHFALRLVLWVGSGSGGLAAVAEGLQTVVAYAAGLEGAGGLEVLEFEEDSAVGYVRTCTDRLSKEGRGGGDGRRTNPPLLRGWRIR